MAKRALAPKKTLIDPLFVFPPGSEDEFVHSREGTDGDVYILGEDISEESFTDDGDSDDDWDDDGVPDDLAMLETPEDFQVIEQILRRGPGGQQVVDIVIEAEEILGATNYEIQVVKV
jgi:hypothetical protein